MNPPPSASFTYTPTNPSIEDTVDFIDTSTDDEIIESWYWEFGDGATSSERNPTHKFGDKGSYMVKLTVTDNNGATNSTEKTVTIINLAPNADFTFSPSSPTAGHDVSFTDLSTDPEGREIASWLWDFLHSSYR